MPVFLRLMLFFAVPCILYYFLFYKHGNYKNRPNAGAFFFEMDQLVLNTGIPYPIPFAEIDYVELEYSSWEQEHQLSYNLWVKVTRKNGKTKRVFYKGYGTADLARPADMQAALEAKGVRVVMTDVSKKK